MAIVKEKAGNGEVSITDVARRARVSVGTVSRVINQHPKVDPLLRRRVHIASRQLGFIPRLQRHCIALVTGRRNPSLPPIGFVSVMTTLISQYLAQSRYAVELLSVDNLELLYEAQTQGAIGITFDERLVEALKIPKLPILTINGPSLAKHGIHCVRADHYQQGLLAAEHCIRRGHREIGFLVVDTSTFGAGERLRGFKDATSAAGLSVEPSWVQPTMSGKIYDILARWTSNGITAILNFSEDVSLEVLHILSNILKLRIGKDISVISLEDVSIYQYLNPPQTTVSQPLDELARLAVQTMLDLCDGKANPGVVDLCLPTRLIERDSVATIRP